jgi:predicted enzyme related to lactoylglutathione lyase
MTTGARKVGEFCWFNMLTPHPAEARAFFDELLGWTYEEIPGVGHVVQVGGRNVGGLFDLDGPRTPAGTPPLIGVMVKVESADATGAKVASLGGRAKPAFDVMDQGRMAVLTDPNGAEFDVWEPKKSQGADVDPRRHGAPSWFECRATDAARASTFYSDLFGWSAEVTRLPHGPEYTTFKLDDAEVAGMRSITPQMEGLRPGWATYFTVDDADATSRHAVELGAKIVFPMRDVPGVGRFCGVESPQGVPFCVIEYAR